MKNIRLVDIKNSNEKSMEYGKMVERSVLKKVYDKSGNIHILRMRNATEKDIHGMEEMDYYNLPLNDGYDLIHDSLVPVFELADRNNGNIFMQSMVLMYKPDKTIMLDNNSMRTIREYCITPIQVSNRTVRKAIIDRSSLKVDSRSHHVYLEDVVKETFKEEDVNGELTEKVVYRSTTDTYRRLIHDFTSANNVTVYDYMEDEKVINTFLEKANLTVRQTEILKFRYYQNASVREMMKKYHNTERAIQKSIEAIREKATKLKYIKPEHKKPVIYAHIGKDVELKDFYYYFNFSTYDIYLYCYDWNRDKSHDEKKKAWIKERKKENRKIEERYKKKTLASPVKIVKPKKPQVVKAYKKYIGSFAYNSYFLLNDLSDSKPKKTEKISLKECKATKEQLLFLEDLKKNKKKKNPYDSKIWYKQAMDRTHDKMMKILEEKKRKAKKEYMLKVGINYMNKLDASGKDTSIVFDRLCAYADRHDLTF